MNLAKISMAFLTMVFLPLVAFAQSSPPAEALDPGGAEKISVLIVDGQNNHGAWPKTTMMMKSCLEETGKFDVDVYRTHFTWNGKELLKEFPLDDGKTYEDLPKAKSDPDFKPDFSKYQVVISNFGHGAEPWPESTQAAFVQYVKNGGGFVSIHAADNSFPEWREYNEMIGIGGWGGATKPAVRTCITTPTAKSFEIPAREVAAVTVPSTNFQS